MEQDGVFMGKVYRHFSREFKLNAVQMVIGNGVAVGKVARELDIHPNMLHLWKRKYLAAGDKAFVGKGRAKPDDVKLRRLRRELRKVKEERDIFKKALASFSKQKR